MTSNFVIYSYRIEGMSRVEKKKKKKNRREERVGVPLKPRILRVLADVVFLIGGSS